MCLCTTSQHNISDSISRPMNMSISPPTSSPVIKNIGSDDGMISWNDITIQEDETCYLLSIDMPNVNGKDVNITLQKNIITISGYRRCARSSRSLSFSSTSTNSSTSSSEDDEQEQQQQQQERSHHKRQRLVSRRLEIDSNIIDIDRAIANTWNGSLTLYAPKRRLTSN